MNEERTYLDYIEDIQDAIEKVALFIHGFDEEQFVQDDKTVFAVIRAFEILGEAAKQIPASIRAQYAEVPWKEMAQMRDKLIHHYFGVPQRGVEDGDRAVANPTTADQASVAGNA
jgi:uncharacterized protein with HEPN domain